MTKTATRRRGRPSLTEADIAAHKARIAAIAERLFREEGYQGISMRRLAVEAECAPMTLYAYFGSKAAILQTIWLAFFDELFADLEVRAAAVADPKDRLRTIARAYAAYWIANPDRYRMVYMTEGVKPEEVGVFVRDSGAVERFDIFFDTLALAGPSLSEGEVKVRGELLVSALQGIAYNHITTSAYPWEPADALVDALIGCLV
jgi:AcrR family transcriptional regulator